MYVKAITKKKYIFFLKEKKILRIAYKIDLVYLTFLETTGIEETRVQIRQTLIYRLFGGLFLLFQSLIMFSIMIKIITTSCRLLGKTIQKVKNTRNFSDFFFQLNCSSLLKMRRIDSVSIKNYRRGINIPNVIANEVERRRECKIKREKT